MVPSISVSNISIKEGLTRKKKCEISHLGGGGGSGQNWIIFMLFFFFFLSCPKSCKSAKKIFLVRGEVIPLPQSQNFLDILGTNLVSFLALEVKK